MTRWRVCGKHDLDVDVPLESSSRQDRPFNHFPLTDISKHALCRERLIGQAAPAETVLELFAGLGVSSVVHRARGPREHVVNERDPRLVAHLRANGFNATRDDAHTVIQFCSPRDLLDCDFGRFTVLQWQRSAALVAFTDAAFRGGHREILFTDEATIGLGANRDKYAAVLGVKVTGLDDYIQGWSRLWFDRYGYSIAAAERHRGAVYTLWRQQPPVAVAANLTRADYPGVEIL